MYHALVIGKGPAGIQAAIYIARARMSVAVVGMDGGSLQSASLIDGYYGLAEPVSGPELQKIGEAQARRLGVSFADGQVVGAGFTDSGFYALTPGERLEARALLIATGAKRAKAPVEGLGAYEGKGVSYCAVCDGFFFRGKNVGVLGYTDYAVQEAVELSSVASGVAIYTNGAEPDIGPIAQKQAGQFAFVREPVAGLFGDGRLEGLRFCGGGEARLDGLFVAYGIAGSADIAKKLGVALSPKGDIATGRDQATNIPGVFAAGDCTGLFRQIPVAAGQGAVAAQSMIAYIRENSRGGTATTAHGCGL
ncbi:MAG: NAD(P)/FAD-dependent oxidoreductase [Clostridiales bacterium]|jgi:thioredoxin reductase (NADPH)|nr:NAD(P)/FAD-dependent oxidoreductase [Clostridiales bacterium]